MSEEVIEKDGLKIKKLVKLSPSTAEEYKEAMLNRVEYFKKKNQEKSVFNSTVKNVVVKGLSTLLNVKVQVDKALGEENLEKVHDALDQVLLFGL
ncbi:MAG: hypothetical protein BAJALOKI2v1_140020 [Promethearchaeota archaeon]|nr:MAG: hypothetical protein BAJALOKI2v1_140020 [Candidatus Lokiarchaeota archaeon]